MKNYTELDNGVYYNRQDYAGLLKRIAIVCIDLPILILIGVVIWWLWFTLNPELENLPESYLWVIILISYLY